MFGVTIGMNDVRILAVSKPTFLCQYRGATLDRKIAQRRVGNFVCARLSGA